MNEPPPNLEREEGACKDKNRQSGTRSTQTMTAFPCYDNIADTLWTFANGENLARDRKVFLKGNKLLCYSEKHTALMTADFDRYWASTLSNRVKTLEFTPMKTKTAVERVFVLKGEALERDIRKIEDYVPGVSWMKSVRIPEGFNTSTQKEFRAMAKEMFDGKITLDRLYFVQRLRSLVTDIFQTPLYFWVHGESFDIFYFRRIKTEKGFKRYVP